MYFDEESTTVYITVVKTLLQDVRTQELCEGRGGRPGLPVPNSPYGLYGRKATFEEEEEEANVFDASERLAGRALVKNA